MRNVMSNMMFSLTIPLANVETEIELQVEHTSKRNLIDLCKHKWLTRSAHAKRWSNNVRCTHKNENQQPKVQKQVWKQKTWKCKKWKDRKGRNEITPTKVLCNNDVHICHFVIFKAIEKIKYFFKLLSHLAI
jgi:hypothetical protein